MSNPKPCPFCGPRDAPSLKECRTSPPFDEPLYWLRCVICSRTSVTAADDEEGRAEAAADWNQRPIEDALRERLVAAEKKLELKWLIEEQLGAALARAETAERELDEALRRVDIAHEGTGNAWAETERITAERDRLREYVGRLEAALVRLHEIYAWGVQQNDDDEHETWWKAALECVALGREIVGREP